MTPAGFDPTDPASWLGRGRTADHAATLARIWQTYPDLPATAPQGDRLARIRERVQAMRPLTEEISRQAEAERQARNFAFVKAKAERGDASATDKAILIGRADHGYAWNEAVEYAHGWYAAYSGAQARGPLKPFRGCLDPRLVAAYHQGFRDGGGNSDDLFDAARRANLAAAREAGTRKAAPVRIARPLPSTWPQPSDAQRPSPWPRRLIIMGAPEALEGMADRLLKEPGGTDAAVILLCARNGFHSLRECCSLEPVLEAARAEVLAQDDAQGATLAKLVASQAYDDILIAAQGDYLRIIDAHAAVLPLCRNMERLRHTRLLQNAQFRTWLARGHEPGRPIAGGHIRWSKVAQGLSARLSEFTVRYTGKLPNRGHRIIVETVDGRPATGCVTAQGDALAWEIMISNKSHLRTAMSSQLRTFGGAIRLALQDPVDGAGQPPATHSSQLYKR